MAAELTLRLNDAREVSPNLWPRTIALSTRQGECDRIYYITFQRLKIGLPWIRLERVAAEAGTIPVRAERDDRCRCCRGRETLEGARGTVKQLETVVHEDHARLPLLPWCRGGGGESAGYRRLLVENTKQPEQEETQSEQRRRGG